MKSIEYFKKLKKSKNRKIKFIDDFVIKFQITKKDEINLKKLLVKLTNKTENKKKFTNYNSCFNYLNLTKFYKVNKDLNLMVEVESIIIKILKKNNILNNYIKGIEFPVTLRIAHPKKPNQVKKYQTSSIHCDPWAGEPKDLINIVFYLSVSKDASKLNIFKTNEEQVKINKRNSLLYKSTNFIHSKKYYEYIKNFEKASKCKVEHKNGFCYLFNGFVPHNTIREGNKIRISIECRLRTENPYSNQKLFLNKINRGGRYWFLPPNKKIDNFKNRLRYEFINLKKEINSKKKITLRKKDLVKFHNYK